MKDVIILLEDKDQVIENFKEWQEDSDNLFDLVVCKTYKEYENSISNEDIRSRLKCVILDLSNNPDEDAKREFEATRYIAEMYASNRIPIFIHSALLADYTDISDKGTVFKVVKSNTSAKEIGDTIELMAKSGFLNIFSFGGTLENKIMTELHRAFTMQFKGQEIQEIIKCISSDNPDNVAQRTQEVFERLALRAVYQNSLSNNNPDASIKVNSIEHYFRRTNLDKFGFWTGDIFSSENQDGKKEYFFIATPRCNVSNCNYNGILICQIAPYTEQQLKDLQNSILDNKVKVPRGVEKVKDFITDNRVGERLRFLPKTPQFEGGFVDFVMIHTVSKEKLTANYSYVISLIDDLTNDVVRKLANYLLRGGISDTAYGEAYQYHAEVVKA